jgi:hypothetical protein
MVPLTVAVVCAETRAGTNSSEHARVRDRNTSSILSTDVSMSHGIASTLCLVLGCKFAVYLD